MGFNIRRQLLVAYVSFLYSICPLFLTDLMIDCRQLFFGELYSTTMSDALIPIKMFSTQESHWLIRYSYALGTAYFIQNLLFHSPIMYHFALEEFREYRFFWKPSPQWLLHFGFTIQFIPFLVSEGVLGLVPIYDTFVRASYFFPICVAIFILMEECGTHSRMRVWILQNEGN